MKKKRLIPVVLFKNGYVVQSRNFSVHRSIGLLDATLRRLDEWNADEVILIDISSRELDGGFTGRLDTASRFSDSFLEAVSTHAHFGSMPLTVGGGLHSMAQVEQLFRAGADKILLGTAVYKSPELVLEIAEKFGSQAIVFSLDYREASGERTVHYSGGRIPVASSLGQVVQMADELGVGEIMLHAISRDGSKAGMDESVISELGQVSVPLIVCGGAGNPSHMFDLIQSDKIEAVAAANYFHHVESSVQLARTALIQSGASIRNPGTD